MSLVNIKKIDKVCNERIGDRRTADRQDYGRGHRQIERSQTSPAHYFAVTHGPYVSSK